MVFLSILLQIQHNLDLKIKFENKAFVFEAIVSLTRIYPTLPVTSCSVETRKLLLKLLKNRFFCH